MKLNEKGKQMTFSIQVNSTSLKECLTVAYYWLLIDIHVKTDLPSIILFYFNLSTSLLCFPLKRSYCWLQASSKSAIKQIQLYNSTCSHMSKSNILKSCAVLLVLTLISLAVWDSTEPLAPAKQRLLLTYQTSSTRSTNIANSCPSNLDRTTLASTSDLSTAQTYLSNVKSQLGIDGNTMMNYIVNLKFGDALSLITSNMLNFVTYVGVFFVPFLVFLFIWPFLCCCCCCPSCCPSKCCQKTEGEPYTKCELQWPACTLALALLLIISISVYGFLTVNNVGKAFQNMGCSLAIFTDDLLNGNVTADGTSFFTGLNVFSTSLTSLSGNLTNIQGNLTDLSNLASGTTYTDVNNLLTVQNNYIKKIPDNAGTGSMSLSYSTPINSASTTGTLTSSFVNILGTWSTSSTLVYNLYASVQYARVLMNGIKSNSSTFSGQVATIQSSVASIQSTLNSLISNVNSMDSGMGTYLGYLKIPQTYGNMGMQAFYGGLIGFSSLALLGLLLTACCDKTGCRYLMYFSCMFLFQAGFLAFFVSFAFSVLVPIFTWTCDYLTVAVGSSSGFKTNFGAFLSNTTLNQISPCMPFGDGNIVNTVGGSATTGLNSLTSVITSLSTFSNGTLQSWISSNLSALWTTSSYYANGDISDLDTTNNNILASYSYSTNTTNNASCTGFTDSWVPSNNQQTSYSTAIPCQSSSGNTGSLSTCDASFAPSGTCKGCMDTTQLLTQHANAAAVVAAVKSKYGASCAFANILGNTWTNYFTKKYTSLGYPTVKTQVSGTVMYRIQQAQPQINTTTAGSVFASLDEFRGVLNTVKTGMSSISSLTDPTYGMLAGLNCKIFGQDFVTFQNVICGSFFTNVYLIRLTFGIAGWGILFSMCCIVCTGVRHYKQSNRRARVAAEISHRNSYEDSGSKRNLRKIKNRFDNEDDE